MPLTRVTITKQCPFRNGSEEFSNGYTMTVDHDGLDDAAKIALIDALVAVERVFHAPSVTWTKGTTAPLGGDVSHIRTLSSTGQRTDAQAVPQHPEACQMAEASVAAGRTLRKYYHVGKAFPMSNGDNLNNNDVQAAFLVKFTDGTLPGGAKVCAPNGDIPSSAWSWDPYMRVHQFRAGSVRPPVA